MDDLILHLIANKNRVNLVECLSFYKKRKQDDFVTITHQALVKNDNIWIRWYLLICSEIIPKNTSEVELAINHINDLKDKINLNKTITVYDMGYNSTKLILYHLINKSNS